MSGFPAITGGSWKMTGPIVTSAGSAGPAAAFANPLYDARNIPSGNRTVGEVGRAGVALAMTPHDFHDDVPRGLPRPPVPVREVVPSGTPRFATSSISGQRLPAAVLPARPHGTSAHVRPSTMASNGPRTPSGVPLLPVAVPAPIMPPQNTAGPRYPPPQATANLQPVGRPGVAVPRAATLDTFFQRRPLAPGEVPSAVPAPRPTIAGAAYNGPNILGIVPPPPGLTPEQLQAYIDEQDRLMIDRIMRESEAEYAQVKNAKREQIKSLAICGAILPSGEFKSSVLLSRPSHVLNFVKYLDSIDGKTEAEIRAMKLAKVGSATAAKSSPSSSTAELPPVSVVVAPNPARQRVAALMFSVCVAKVSGRIPLTFIELDSGGLMVSGSTAPVHVVDPRDHPLRKHKLHTPFVSGVKGLGPAMRREYLDKSPAAGDLLTAVEDEVFPAKRIPAYIQRFNERVAACGDNVLMRFSRKFVCDDGEPTEVPWNYELTDVPAPSMQPVAAAPPPVTVSPAPAMPVPPVTPPTSWGDCVSDPSRLREALVTLLLTEQQALKWYPAPAKGYCLDLLDRLNIPAAPTKEFEDLMLSILKDEEKTLKDGLVAMPSRPGCYPDILMPYNQTPTVTTREAEDGIEILDSDDDGHSYTAAKRAKTN